MLIDPTISESVVIDVFDMLIQRINTVEDVLMRMNAYLVNEARFKTNDTISGKIFQYPFEIHNHGFDKQRQAYIHIQLSQITQKKTIYDILLSIWDCDVLTNDELLLQQNLHEFIKILLDNKYQDVYDGIAEYLKNESREEYLTTLHYGIDTFYLNIIEYILNEYITQKEKENGFTHYSHYEDTISMCFVHPYPHKTLYIDELLQHILKRLYVYGISPSDIQYVQVSYIDKHLIQLCKYYDMNGGCSNKEKRNILTRQYLQTLDHSVKKSLLVHMIEYANSLPFTKDDADVSYIIDVLMS